LQSLLKDAARQGADEVLAKGQPQQQARSSWRDGVSELVELSGVLSKLPGFQPAQQPAQPVAPPVKEANPNELILLLEAFKVAKEMNDPSLAEVLRDYLRPPDQTGVWEKALDFGSKVIESIPMVLPMIASIRQGMTAHQPAQPEASMQPGEEKKALPQSQPVQQPVDPATRAFQKAIGRLIQDCWDGDDFGSALEAVVSLPDRYPVHEAFVKKLMESPPDEVLDMIVEIMPGAAKIKELPHSRQWIMNLQAEYSNQFSEDESGPEMNL